MAAFGSVASTNFSTSEVTSINITKPANLAAGDLLLAVLAKSDTVNAGTSDILTPSGWTYGGEQKFFGSEAELNFAYKIADASDVAASNFTFTADEGCHLGGILLRITDPAEGSEVAASEFDTATGTTISHTANSAPVSPSSLIVSAFAGANNNGGKSVASYTSTPSVTFTEAAEISQGISGSNPVLAVAYGAYTGDTTFTAYGATFNVSADSAGLLIILNNITNASGTNALLSVAPTIFNNAGVEVGGNGTNALHEAEPELFEQSGRASSPTQWTNPDKPDTTWTKKSL